MQSLRPMGVTHAEALSLFTRLLPQTQPDHSLPKNGSDPHPDNPSSPYDPPSAKDEARPSAAKEDPLIYHYPVPLHRVSTYDPNRLHATRLIFSLTATSGVYSLLEGQPLTPDRTQSLSQNASQSTFDHHKARSGQHARDIVFLHRPFNLQRNLVPHGTLVLQSHTKFDEIYTTGFNEAFARQHDVDVASAKCLKGYKGDPDRRIGLVGRLQQRHESSTQADSHDGKSRWTTRALVDRLIEDFGGFEALEFHGAEDHQVKVVTSLNAFTREVIGRVLEAARKPGSEASTQPEMTKDNVRNESVAGLSANPAVLVLTGAAKGREDGMAAAREAGFAVLAVGHRRSEMWGLRYLAEQAKQQFGEKLEIVVIDEPEDEDRRENEARMNRQNGRHAPKVAPNSRG